MPPRQKPKGEKGLGDWARSDINHQHSQMRRGKGESIENFAARLYDTQMEVYSAYCGRDLGTPFFTQPAAIQRSWIKVAREHKPENR